LLTFLIFQIPMAIYQALKEPIEALLEDEEEYILFEPANYVENPVALARIKAHITREELAQRLDVSKGYIAKIEHSALVTDKMLARVKAVL